MKDYLPVGSIILLKGGLKPLMVFGIKQIDPEGTNTEYDYVSVPYPEGNIGVQYQYMFNHDDIHDVLFRGYDTPERINFLIALESFMKSNEHNAL